MSTDVLTAPALAERVTLSEVRKRAGISVGSMHRACELGLLTPDRPRQNPPGVLGRPAFTLTAEDALFAILVAGIAVAAGVAFLTMLRTMRANGARLDRDAGGLVIPVHGMSVAA